MASQRKAPQRMTPEDKQAITDEWAGKFFRHFGDAEERAEHRAMTGQSAWTASLCADLVVMANEARSEGATIFSAGAGAIRDLAGIGYRTLFLSRRGLQVGCAAPRPWLALRNELSKRNVTRLDAFTEEVVLHFSSKHGGKICLSRFSFDFTADQLEKLAQPMLKNGYGQYLLKVLRDQVF